MNNALHIIVRRQTIKKKSTGTMYISVVSLVLLLTIFGPLLILWPPVNCYVMRLRWGRRLVKTSYYAFSPTDEDLDSVVDHGLIVDTP